MAEATVEATKPAESKFAVTGEGRLLLDLVKFPAHAGKTNEDHYQLMRAISGRFPGILDRIVATLERTDLPERKRKYFKLLDEVYGVSTREPRSLSEIARERGVTVENIRQTKSRALRHLLNTVEIETTGSNQRLAAIKLRVGHELFGETSTPVVSFHPRATRKVS